MQSAGSTPASTKFCILGQDTLKTQKRDDSGVAESDPERAEELIGQLNDAFIKTEYKDVPLTER